MKLKKRIKILETQISQLKNKFNATVLQSLILVIPT